MTLKEYFQNTAGTGILATADSDGRVDAAVYSRPHVMDDGSLAFIMRERLTFKNLQTNSYAAYLFMAHGAHLKGLRLFMKKTKQDRDEELIAGLTRRNLNPEEDKAAGPKHIVYFTVEKILTLVGPDEIEIELH